MEGERERKREREREIICTFVKLSFKLFNVKLCDYFFHKSFSESCHFMYNSISCQRIHSNLTDNEGSLTCKAQIAV